MPDPREMMAEYRCPGARYAISRSVHLGRLAQFYPGCRTCEHRHETGLLSARLVKQLRETEHRGQEAPLFQAEVAGDLPLGSLAPGTVRNVAASLGMSVVRGLLSDTPSQTASQPPGSALQVGREPSEAVVVVAGDGRPAVAELVAAACEGLRFAGCHVVDLGMTHTASLMFAIDHLRAVGGLLVGAGQSQGERVGLKLFAPGPVPLSKGAGLDTIQQQFERGIDRPTRRFGGLRHFQAERPYLDLLRPHYHAMRPLRFVLHCACPPVVTTIDHLLTGLACTAVVGPARAAELSERVRAEEAHFGMLIDDDGERCRTVDERGRAVETDRLLRLIAGRLVAHHDEPGVVVVPRDAGWSQPAGNGYGPSYRVERVGTALSRAAMAAAMRRSGAVCGGTLDGCFWYGTPGGPLPDALHTLTHLLAVLSRSDRPFSLVLDREAPGG